MGAVRRGRERASRGFVESSEHVGLCAAGNIVPTPQGIGIDDTREDDARADESLECGALALRMQHVLVAGDERTQQRPTAARESTGRHFSHRPSAVWIWTRATRSLHASFDIPFVDDQERRHLYHAELLDELRLLLGGHADEIEGVVVVAALKDLSQKRLHASGMPAPLAVDEDELPPRPQRPQR